MINLQITAGLGPLECCYVVTEVFKRMEAEANAKELLLESIESENISQVGASAMRSILVRIEGECESSFAKTWIGTVLWRGISPYRPQHKRKNWYVSVHELDVQDTHISENSRISFVPMKSQGPGGQNVNKTNSAVRATHVETGITVISREERSLVQNKKEAERKIRTALKQESEEIRKGNETRERRSQLSVTRGNPIRTFTGREFKELKR